MGRKIDGCREVFALHQARLQRAPYDALSLLRSNLLSLADKLELVRWFGAVPRLDAHAMRDVSVQAWLERSMSRPSLRRLMAAVARTLVFSAALDLVTAEVFITQVQMAFKHPVLYVDRGRQTLVDGLRRAAEETGTRIVSGARHASRSPTSNGSASPTSSCAPAPAAICRPCWACWPKTPRSSAMAAARSRPRSGRGIGPTKWRAAC
jgi:phytoene dehydrogenase-like protein